MTLIVVWDASWDYPNLTNLNLLRYLTFHYVIDCLDFMKI